MKQLWWNSRTLYQTLLHVAVVVLGCEVVFLSLENRKLGGPQRQHIEQPVSGELFNYGDLVTTSGERATLRKCNRLVFIYTTDCSYCKENISNWQSLARTAAALDCEAIGLSLEPVDTASTTTEVDVMSFPSFVVCDRGSFSAFNHIGSVPMTVFVSADGRIVDSWRGVLTNSMVDEIGRSILEFGVDQRNAAPGINGS